MAQQQYRKPVKAVKNVIVMIPDGTSIGVISAARWYQIYNGGDQNLFIDPYFTGTVKTFSSNAPIGDSAPTTSAYMTGMPQQTGNVAIYPLADPGNDLVPVDPSMAYQPLATILEASRISQKKAVGMVVTHEFYQATPSDCAAHHYNRQAAKPIASQIAHSNLDVLFASGNKQISEDIKEHLKSNGTALIQDDVAAFRKYNGESKLWAIFHPANMPLDLDQDRSVTPSIEEMTDKAINRLNKSENGFFLMVEGSQVDWAAHSNDAAGLMTEFLAFDRAVKVAMDFAKKDGNTAVVILTDHGNSGFTLGSERCPGYDKLSISRLYESVSKFKRTANGMTNIIKETPDNQIAQVFKKYTDIDLSADDLQYLITHKENKPLPNAKGIPAYMPLMWRITTIMNDVTCFGYTTTGHTGEEVFLAAYHPHGDVPMGMNTNVEINKYLYDVSGLSTTLPELTKQIFAKHTEVFAGLKYTVDITNPEFPKLVVKKGKNTLTIPAFQSVGILNGKAFDLNSVCVYIDKNETFYLPADLAKHLDKK
ncbi:alkaline phosphatase [Bacteroidales bacterium]|nr:alkaline phosphatase [Bacteroidales bacterium]